MIHSNWLNGKQINLKNPSFNASKIRITNNRLESFIKKYAWNDSLRLRMDYAWKYCARSKLHWNSLIYRRFELKPLTRDLLKANAIQKLYIQSVDVTHVTPVYSKPKLFRKPSVKERERKNEQVGVLLYGLRLMRMPRLQSGELLFWNASKKH